MNYRHAYHAGNFADVMKHVVLTRVLAHLRLKPAPFRFVETHAGAGLYDLAGPEAAKTGEWQNGIGRLFHAPVTGELAKLLRSYREAIALYNPDNAPRVYPGSPLIAQTLLRPQDRAILCELVPEEVRALNLRLRSDDRIKIVEIDAWTALNAYIPPKERRGLVLIDPPFEAPRELEQGLDALHKAQRKWATGIYLFWYPIKSASEGARVAQRVLKSGIANVLQAELLVKSAAADRLIGSGLLIVNPPYPLEAQLHVLLPALARLLGDDDAARARCSWISGAL